MNRIEDPNTSQFVESLTFQESNNLERSGAGKVSEFLHNPENFESVVRLAQEVVRERPVHVLYELLDQQNEAHERIARIRELGQSGDRRVADVIFRPDDHDLPRGAAVAEVLNQSNFWDGSHRFSKFENEVLGAGEITGQDVSIILNDIHNLSETARNFLLEKLTGLDLKRKGGIRAKSQVNVEFIATADPTKFPEIEQWRTLFNKPEEINFEVSEQKARNSTVIIRDAIDQLDVQKSVDVVSPKRSGKSIIAAVLRNELRGSVFIVSTDKLLRTYKSIDEINWPPPRSGEVVFIDNAELLPSSPNFKEKLVKFYGDKDVVFLYKSNSENDLTSGQ